MMTDASASMDELFDLCLAVDTSDDRVDSLLDMAVPRPTLQAPLDALTTTPTLVSTPKSDVGDLTEFEATLESMFGDSAALVDIAYPLQPVEKTLSPPKRKPSPLAASRGTKRVKTSSPGNVNADGRVGCNCSKRKCQTLYCICFRAGLACDPSICIRCVGNCCNDTDNPAGVRQKRRDFCNCRKTKCDKNYCECRLAGRACGPKCHCNKSCCSNLVQQTVQGV